MIHKDIRYRRFQRRNAIAKKLIHFKKNHNISFKPLYINNLLNEGLIPVGYLSSQPIGWLNKNKPTKYLRNLDRISHHSNNCFRYRTIRDKKTITSMNEQLNDYLRLEF